MAATGKAGQPDLRADNARTEILKPIGSRKIVVGLGKDIPAEGPARVDLEGRTRIDHAPLGLGGIHRPGPETGGVLLRDTGNAQRVPAALEALAELYLAEKTLTGVVGRRDCRIGGRREHKVIGRGDTDAERIRRRIARCQEPRLPLDRVVGNFEIGQCGNRHAEKFERCLFQPDCLGFTVLDDLACLDLPRRCPRRVLRAGFAGRIDTVVERVDDAAAAFRTFGSQPGPVRRLDAQGIDEAVGEIVCQIEFIGEDPVAVRFDQFNLADCPQSRRFLIVFNAFGNKLVGTVVDLHAAAGDNQTAVIVIGQFICGQKQAGALGHINGDRC